MKYMCRCDTCVAGTCVIHLLYTCNTPKTPHIYYMYGTTGHALQVWHNWPCITGMAQLAMYYMCGTTGHVYVWHKVTMYYVWHNWPCIICVAQLTMYNRCGTTDHVLQVWHNWRCSCGTTSDVVVAQLAMYYMCGTTGHELYVWHNWQCIMYVAQLAICKDENRI